MSTAELPALPANEKTYAGIPEAVFVVSRNGIFRLRQPNLTKHVHDNPNGATYSFIHSELTQ